MSFGSWNITGYTPGAGRRPLNSRMFAGQFNCNLRGANVFGFGGPRVTINNYGDYGCYDDGCSGPSKLSMWLMLGGGIADALGSLFRCFCASPSGGGGGGKSVSATGQDGNGLNAKDAQDLAYLKSVYKENCDIIGPSGSGGYTIIDKKTKEKLPMKDLDAVKAYLEGNDAYNNKTKDVKSNDNPGNTQKDPAVEDPNAKQPEVKAPENEAAAKAEEQAKIDEFNKAWGDKASIEKLDQPDEDGNQYKLTYTGADGKPVTVNVKDLEAAEAKLKEANIEKPTSKPDAKETTTEKDKPDTKPDTKPEAKEAAPAVKKPASQGTAAASVKPAAAKPAAAKPAAKPEAAKPAAKKVVVSKPYVNQQADKIYNSVSGLGTKTGQLQSTLSNISGTTIVGVCQTYKAKHGEGVFESICDEWGLANGKGGKKDYIDQILNKLGHFVNENVPANERSTYLNRINKLKANEYYSTVDMHKSQTSKAQLSKQQSAAFNQLINDLSKYMILS